MAKISQGIDKKKSTPWKQEPQLACTKRKYMYLLNKTHCPMDFCIYLFVWLATVDADCFSEAWGDKSWTEAERCVLAVPAPINVLDQHVAVPEVALDGKL